MVLREAGEYLQKKIKEETSNFILKCGKLIIIASILIGLSLPQVLEIIFQSYTTNIISFLQIGLLLVVIFGAKKLSLLDKVLLKNTNNNQKGIEGEKLVQYELSLLQGKHKEFYVIQDFQDAIVGNIDHIIICKLGVFAIETKNYNIISRKNKLDAVEQGKKEAAKLQEILKDKFKVNRVQAIVAFPNKWIDEKENYLPAKVVNHKRIYSIIENSQKKISEEKLKDIYIFLVNLQQKKS